MKKIPVIAAILAFLPFVACHKPEVVPTPAQKATLNVHFQGIINGTDVEWTKNVNGYKMVPTHETSPNATPGLVDWKYYAGIESDADPTAIRIGLGSMLHDPTVSPEPSQASFEAFIRSFGDPATAPGYSDKAEDGFELQYVDQAGDLFRSEEATPGTYSFSTIEAKKDDNGDYIQFTCAFDAVVFHRRHDNVNNIDTINKTAVIQNAVFTGWFKRKD